MSGIRHAWGMAAPGMVNALAETGVQPAFPLDQTIVHIYRRADVAKAQRKLEKVQ